MRLCNQIPLPTWLEIEDNMAAKHAHKRQKTDFKYGDNIKLCMGKFKKSEIVTMSKCVLKMPTSEMY